MAQGVPMRSAQLPIPEGYKLTATVGLCRCLTADIVADRTHGVFRTISNADAVVHKTRNRDGASNHVAGCSDISPVTISRIALYGWP